MNDTTQTTRFRFWLWLIRVIGVIVPRRLRADWRQEWEAELRYRERLLSQWDRLDRRAKLDLLRRSASAFWDALVLQPQRLEDEMFQDLRFGVRMMLKNKGFTTVAVITLALGIGANTAVFTLINALLLRPLSVANPHELVVINARTQGRPSNISFPMYRDLRDRQEVFSGILAGAGENIIRLTIPDGSATVEVDNVRASLVTANYWSVLGVRPALGRFFTEAEDRIPNSSETAGSLAVLSYSFWERQFGSDPGVLSRTVLVNRSRCQVIGVAPRGFFGEQVGSEPDLWTPLISFSSPDILENRRAQFTHEIGRLKPGVSGEQAQTAMTLLFFIFVEDVRDQVTHVFM
jgi:hypothetical protein